MARIHRYTKGKVTLSDTLVGTDVENQKATVNIPIAAIVDIAIDYFNVNGNGDGINQSLLDITTSIDGNTQSIATYQNIVNTLTNEFTSIVNRTETLESSFTTNVDGDITISTANITNFAETIAAEGFASATTLDSLSSTVQQIIDGQTVIDTYATIDQLANTTSTLEGSIATLEDTLTAGYQAYTDGILTTDAFASAVQGVEVQATDSFASSTEYTNLKANFGTFDANGNLLTLSSAFASSVLTAYTDDTLATASDLTTLEATLETYTDGQLASYSNTAATNQLITTATQNSATAQDLTNLQATLETYVDGAISGASNAGITSSYLTSVLADYAEATDLTALEASIGTFDANGNITGLSTAFATQVTSAVATDTFAEVTDLNELKAEIGTFDTNGNLTGLSTALTSEITSAIATEGYAQVTDINELKAEIGTFDANGNLTGLSTAFSNEVTDVIASENLASASSVSTLEATVNGNTAAVNTNQSAIADIDGNLTAAYGITVDSGGSIAGMQLLSDSNTGSSISFNSDVFTINVNGTDISPFIVNSNGIALNGQVTFSNASTGQGIDFDDLETYLSENDFTTQSDLPDTSSFLDQAALGQYLSDNGYVTGNTAGITEVQLLNILSGQNTTANTVINGSNITTGIIASGDFEMPLNSALSGFSNAGMGINLDNSSIHAEQFYINSDGTANFGGTHSAGSIGSWTVDSSGALKDGSSEIVLDPSGNYTQAGTEKLVLSSEDLPAIAPSAAVSANFSFPPNSFWSSPGTNAEDEDYYLDDYASGARTGGVSQNSGAKRFKYYLPDITGVKTGINATNNIPYDAYAGGTADYSIPYGAGPMVGVSDALNTGAFSATIGLQEEFGKDYGWGSITADSPDFSGGDEFGGGSEPSPSSSGGALDYNAIPNIADVAGFDYEVKVVFKFIFVPSGGGLQPQTLLKTEEKILSSGSVTKNLNEATANILVPQNNASYFGFNLYVPGDWESGQIEGSFTPPPSVDGPSTIGTAANPGEIKVTAEYHYEISNIYVWSANNASAGYDTSAPWFFMQLYAQQYLSSGADLTNSFSNVLFTGASAKTNIGLNGIQVRGNKGFVAMGDVVPGSANAVAQVWGNAQVFGTLTSNTNQTFSDKNLKENINPISNALDTVSKLAPVSFNWKPDMRGVDLETRYGFIAQDIQEVLPTIVKEGEHLTLEHNNIISINTAAIKELVNEINELKEEIKTLKQNNG